ncbi:hypothetical protein [Streptomyces sp. SYSU K217416]
MAVGVVTGTLCGDRCALELLDRTPCVPPADGAQGVAVAFGPGFNTAALRVSWASVDYDGQQTDHFRVRQYGPRRLWDQVETAHRDWEDLGRPGVGRHGLTVTANGTATAWLDTPAHPLICAVSYL